MDNPLQEQQSMLLSRIINQVEMLNENMLALNRAVAETNAYNAQTAEVVDLWTTYVNNVRFNLESNKSLEAPK